MEPTANTSHERDMFEFEFKLDREVSSKSKNLTVLFASTQVLIELLRPGKNMYLKHLYTGKVSDLSVTMEVEHGEDTSTIILSKELFRTYIARIIDLAYAKNPDWSSILKGV